MARARRPFFCGNWKLNGSIAESLALATEVRNGVASFREVDVAVAPSFTALYAVAKRLEDGPVTVSAQDCFWDEKGAFTGEVAPAQLVDVGCKHVIVGHSERRQLFGELDAAVNLKARAALRVGLEPIVCIGETLAERDAGETLGRVQTQLEAAIADMGDDELARVVVAYEPVWAIGTGRTATPAQAQEVHRFIRTRLAARSAALAPKLRILYGGSVKADNICALMAEGDIDGGLVGGASLSAESFVRIVKEGSAA
ncbi:MAG TPA: triose-phosphate isomerase [Polyangia bacterium]|nr:triose-phosphate isomerase [Polyangia bacterium]